jgi:hypothetical protein
VEIATEKVDCALALVAKGRAMKAHEYFKSGQLAAFI